MVSHNLEASQKIDALIASLLEFSKEICTKLRQIILQADSEIIENWKWGPKLLQKWDDLWIRRFQELGDTDFFPGRIEAIVIKKSFRSNNKNFYRRIIYKRDEYRFANRTLIDSSS